MTQEHEAHKLVQEAYTRVAQRQQNSCCGPKSCGCGSAQQQVVPEAELGLSCGDPVAFSQLRTGDVVLDLGSGAGKDVFAAANIVGAGGKAIGVDMNDAMLQLARQNAVRFRLKTGLTNAEFRKGYIESLPVEDGSVDVVISNCVINLSPDKPRVFREIFRALKPGGRMIVSDIVLNRPLPDTLRSNANLYASCIAGALKREEYLGAIQAAGFSRVELLTDRTYEQKTTSVDPITTDIAELLSGVAASVTVLAVRELQKQHCTDAPDSQDKEPETATP